jgi:SAM-dependent methyltransferase
MLIRICCEARRSEAWLSILHLVAVMAFHSRHDRVLRKLVPSVARLSYNPIFKIVGNTIARVLARPFPELRELPPNHLCIRIGCGNRIFNSHVMFLKASSDCWLTFLSRGYCTANADVVELGCGCGRIARVLKEPWFQGTYVGVDIDEEMLSYCRRNFPDGRFEFVLSPHKSRTYHPGKLKHPLVTSGDFVIGKPNSKDFVYAFTLFTHLLESAVADYVRESYSILKIGGILYFNFICIEHVELGRRWTFRHRRGNSYVENLRYPEAAVAYHGEFMANLAANCGFREVTVSPPQGGGQTELLARK